MLIVLLAACGQGGGDDCQPYDPGGGSIACPGDWQLCCVPDTSPPDCYVLAPSGQGYNRNQSAEAHMYCENCSMDSFTRAALCGT